MTRSIQILKPLTLFTLAFATACGAEPTDEDYDDIASSMGALVSDSSGSELEAVEDAVMAAQGMVPPGLSQSATGQIVGQRGQLDYAYTVTCQNEAGRDLAVCDQRTAQARLQLDWTGAVTTARRSATVVRSGDWTLSGIGTETVTVNGAGTLDVEAEFQALNRAAMRTFLLDYDATYADVQVRASDYRPVGGRVTYLVHAERTRSNSFRDVERVFDVDAELTFDAPGQATLVLDGARTYLIDLDARTVTAAP